MAKVFNRKKLTEFIQRRKINALSLTVMTGASVLITLICALTNFKHTDVLVLVSIAMVVLCLLQYFKNRKGFRTLRSFKGSKKKYP